MKKLAIVTTHPIQYYAPVFQTIQQRGQIEIKVFYTWGSDGLNKHDPGFQRTIEWDVPLLDGYPFEWVKNTAKQPGSHHFRGIVNPGLIAGIKYYDPSAILFIGWNYQSHLKAIVYFKRKIPVYFRGDSTLLDRQNDIKSLLKGLLLKWVYRHVDHAFFVGNANKDYFKKYGLWDHQLSFAPHAIDNDRFSVIRNDQAFRLRTELGMSPSSLLVAFAGKFEEKKNPVLLVNAFLKLDNKNYHLLMVGNGDLEVLLRKAAAGAKNIHFMELQNQSTMPVIYQACDLFCLPSQGPGETWGLAVNEAMACSKPVLVSDKVGSAADLVVENKTGSVFASGDEPDLAKKLSMLLASPERLKALGVNAFNLIKDWNFTNIAVAIETRLTNEAKRQD